MEDAELYVKRLKNGNSAGKNTLRPFSKEARWWP